MDYIAAIEAVRSNLTEQEAQELKADVNSLLKRDQVLRANLTREEKKALTQLKKDQDRMVLTADKGVAMAVLDKGYYIQKAGNLLEQSVYKTIDRDPTNSITAKCIQILRRLKRETGMDEGTYKAMYASGCTPPKFYGLPKIHKTGTPLRPIVSSRGSVTYGVAKVLAKVLKPLVGKSPIIIQSTRDFVHRLKGVSLLPGECLCSYDVTTLFTSVPTDPALATIKDQSWNRMTLLQDRTVLSLQNINELLGFCLHNTYFSLQNKFYEHVEGAPMGSLVSLIVANLYMEQFEREAVQSVPTPYVLVQVCG